MFELVVASGKGGTGKTSLTGALADLVGPAVLVDCDVDAADLYLIVPHEVLEEHDFSSSHRAVIDMEACSACSICLESCRFNAIKMTADPEARWRVRYSVDPSACEGCGLCVHLCPEETIRFEKVVSGRWFRSISEAGPFFHARLGIAQSNSGRLVSLLRQKSRETAKELGIDTILIDGPPGIGCPAIATLTDASYLLIVTEPSLSAIHDMQRLADLAEHFGIPAGICINKSDISEEISDEVERFASEKHLPVHGRFPYDPAFTEAQLQGRSYASFTSTKNIEMIRNLWKSITSDAKSRDRNGKRRFAV
ncbi:MAG: ATP-binding protein [Anaerolineales bacterium]|jgi:MinD superfamily P-loop ATPase